MPNQLISAVKSLAEVEIINTLDQGGYPSTVGAGARDIFTMTMNVPANEQWEVVAAGIQVNVDSPDLTITAAVMRVQPNNALGIALASFIPMAVSDYEENFISVTPTKFASVASVLNPPVIIPPGSVVSPMFQMSNVNVSNKVINSGHFAVVMRRYRVVAEEDG